VAYLCHLQIAAIGNLSARKSLHTRDKNHSMILLKIS